MHVENEKQRCHKAILSVEIETLVITGIITDKGMTKGQNLLQSFHQVMQERAAASDAL